MKGSVRKSTFHYGSIKILNVALTTKKEMNLHSTMVLLKCVLYCHKMKGVLNNLHSTMVLLKSVPIKHYI